MGILSPEHLFLYFLSPVPISFGYGYFAGNEGYAYANISRQSTFWVWVFGYAAGDGLSGAGRHKCIPLVLVGFGRSSPWSCYYYCCIQWCLRVCACMRVSEVHQF